LLGRSSPNFATCIGGGKEGGKGREEGEEKGKEVGKGGEGELASLALGGIDAPTHGYNTISVIQ